MNKNRRRLDIVRDMLSVMSSKTRKTKIMYQTNLNYNSLKKYLEILLESGLAECDGNSCYSITSKGKEFLQMYNDYLEHRRQISKEIDETARAKLLLENICFNNKISDKLTTTQKVSVDD